MNKSTLAIVLLSLLAVSVLATETNHYAVLVAGSDGWWNYRHQSDICHAYQILRSNGVPEENIIVFAVDDIANSRQNPFPGKIFNKPDGEDVYAGCKIDYSGKDVTPQNFLDVIKGNKSAMKGKGTGKVLESTSTDKVFINFSDHGATGLIAFPREELYAKDMINAFKYMYENQMYHEMVVYIEACESGSMFEGLLEETWNIYATSASNAVESSWATYCSPDDKVGGKHIGSCLGDLYSVNWMEDTEAADIKSKTVGEQFQTVKDLTTESHVLEFGDSTVSRRVLGVFHGIHDSKELSFFDRLKGKAIEYVNNAKKENVKGPNDARKIDTRDAKLDYLYNVYKKSNDAIDGLRLEDEIHKRSMTDMRFKSFMSDLSIHNSDRALPRDFECLKASVESYKSLCGGLDEYSLKYVAVLAAACEKEISSSEITLELEKVCSEEPTTF